MLVNPSTVTQGKIHYEPDLPIIPFPSFPFLHLLFRIECLVPCVLICTTLSHSINVILDMLIEVLALLVKDGGMGDVLRLKARADMVNRCQFKFVNLEALVAALTAM